MLNLGLEIYGLKIFCQVIQDRTFSAAARRLGLTQPTVSQQIAKLESDLGKRLFERVGHDVIPTRAAQDLYRFASGLLDQVTEFEDGWRDSQSQPQGLVKYAMPESCQWTPHYRRIMAQIRAFPEIRFEIEIQPNDQITRGLLEGRLDFGFVVGERLAPELRFEKFSDEAYSAVASSKDLFLPLRNKEYGALRLITYPGWELFFETWAKANGLWKELKSKLAEPSVRIGTLAGAIHAAQEGAGVSVIPTHCVAEELGTHKLLEWSVKKDASALNPVYLARRIGEKPPKRVELIIQMLKQAKEQIG